MILSRFFKPKWQHADPDARRQALQSLSADDPVRRRLAVEDNDPATRRAALAQLADLDLLRRIGDEDADAGVRDYAQARLRKLLSGQIPGSPPLTERLALLDGTEAIPLELAEHLIREGAEPELRLAALERVQQEALCAERAINDPVARVRSAALERVQDARLLDDIARRTRGRDKRISRIARERAQALHVERERRTEIERLCTELEQLQWDGETGPGAARFSQLEQRWQQIAAQADPHQRERFRQAHDRFAEHFRASAATRATRTALCRRLEELLGELQAEAQHDNAESHRTIEILDRARTDWAATGTVEDPESRRLQRWFEQLARDIETRLAALEHDHRRAAKRHALLDEASGLLTRSGQVLDSELSDLQRRWQHLPQPEARELAGELQSRFERLLAQLQQRLARQTERKEQELANIATGLEALEQALADGELARAIELQQQTEQRLADNIGLSHKQMADFRQQLHGFVPRIAQLRGWRRWGTNRSRESLIEEVERLIDSALEPDELARQVQAARAAWKEMDHTAGGAPRPLWQRFDEACERAYEPVRVQQQAQAEQRRLNQQVRETLCAELEELAVQIDASEQPDWRALSRAVQRAQQQWRQLGPVERRQRKTVERRFQQALQQLQHRLRPELERDIDRRRGLIERAQALVDAEDSRAAVEEIKRLQAEWQPQVLASRREEQALWKQFRAACDAIFEHRRAEREARAAERQSSLDRKQALCDEIEALSAQRGIDPPAARERFRTLCDEWQALGPIPKRAQHDAEQRFREACARFERSLTQRQRQREHERLERLATRAALCERAEALLAGTPGEDAIAELESAWARAPEPGPEDTAALNARFERVLQALRAGDAERRALLDKLETALDERRRLCLRLEIAAGVESPQAFARERMAYQVERLSESLGERAANPDRDGDGPTAQALIRQWYLTPTPPGPEGRSLNARFERAWAALRAEPE